MSLVDSASCTRNIISEQRVLQIRWESHGSLICLHQTGVFFWCGFGRPKDQLRHPSLVWFSYLLFFFDPKKTRVVERSNFEGNENFAAMESQT